MASKDGRVRSALILIFFKTVLRMEGWNPGMDRVRSTLMIILIEPHIEKESISSENLNLS
jgi:hypothetical protein